MVAVDGTIVYRPSELKQSAPEIGEFMAASRHAVRRRIAVPYSQMMRGERGCHCLGRGE
jgi:hypothetical protein